MKKISDVFLSAGNNTVEIRAGKQDLVFNYLRSGLFCLKVFPAGSQRTSITEPCEIFKQEKPCQEIITEHFLIKSSVQGANINVDIYQR